MSISLELVDFDKEFSQLTSIPIIINDQSDSSEEDKEILKTKIFNKYNNDLLSNIPSCDCGDLEGEYRIGMMCHNCNTEVSSSIDKDLQSILWLRAPEGVDGLINPMVWTMLSERFTVSGFDVINWLCDTSYNTHNKQPTAILNEIIDAGFERGYNNFVRNFDRLIDFLFSMKKFQKNKDTISEDLPILIANSRKSIFSKYLPLPNRSLLVIEETNVGTYIDPIVIGAIDAIQTIISIDTAENKHPLKRKENRTIKCIVGLADFYKNFYKETLGRKTGTFRQNVYGSRAHFSFRCVVTSITEKHELDEIYIPWSVGIGIFKFHLINKLYALDYTVNEAEGLLNSYAKIYNPLIDQLFKELIEESPRKGVDATLNRNPTLARGSIQLVRITKVKTDPNINTISFSILVVTPLNADFDGRYLPSINFLNCWKLLRVLLPKQNAKAYM